MFTGERLQLEEVQSVLCPELKIAASISTNTVNSLGVRVQSTQHHTYEVLIQRRSLKLLPSHPYHDAPHPLTDCGHNAKLAPSGSTHWIASASAVR